AGAEVRVLGLEMVYVPAGAFYAGDGVSVGAFEGVGGEPVRIDSAGTVVTSFEFREQPSFSDGVLGGEGVYVDGDGGINTAGAAARIDNAGYPTGYEAFYVGKYELTQGQYAAFLTLLTPEQRAVRNISLETPDPNADIPRDNTYSYVDYRGAISCDESGCRAQYPNRAVSYIGWPDGTAFMDWAGLRPMTELEYEKAARGDQPPIAGEYAWGSTFIAKSKNVLDPASGELATDELEQASGEVTDGNASFGSLFRRGGAGKAGPLRVGIFSETAQGYRQAAGASYYGAMELSGNVSEQTVSLDQHEGRQFQGTHGDGELGDLGFATNSDWPGRQAKGTIVRGGAWYFEADELRTSDRTYMNNEILGRGYLDGIRGARSAPELSQRSTGRGSP
ncbi:MAG: SUMF1/EgtB/PvdO family nonheme iron enzyme, partial [Bacteroidota bacterium]